MAREVDGLEAADCTTDTASHHKAAADLLDLGLHTLCEKPLALTIRGCKNVIAAADGAGRSCRWRENFRRDPINRLVRGAARRRRDRPAPIHHGNDHRRARYAGDHPVAASKLTGTIPLDAGVHNADILQYYFGDAASAFGQTRLYEKTRHVRDAAGPGGFYRKWAANLPDSIEATGEDAIFGTIAFANGALGQWVQHHGGHGEPVAQRLVFGTRGSIAAPGDRNGRPVRLILDDGAEISDERILDYAPSYRLDPVAASLFGGERPWTYDFDFPTTDRKLIAVEQAEVRRLHSRRFRAGSRWRRRVAGCRAGLCAVRIAARRTIGHDRRGRIERGRRLSTRDRSALRSASCFLITWSGKMKLSYSTWGMQTVPIETAVPHCAALGFDGLELTVIPGWTTDAATLDAPARRRIRALYDDHRLELCGLSGNVPLLDGSPAERRAVMTRFRGYLDLAAELRVPGDDPLIVTTTSGGSPRDWDGSAERLVDALGELAAHAQQNRGHGRDRTARRGRAPHAGSGHVGGGTGHVARVDDPFRHQSFQCAGH